MTPTLQIGHPVDLRPQREVRANGEEAADADQPQPIQLRTRPERKSSRKKKGLMGHFRSSDIRKHL